MTATHAPDPVTLSPTVAWSHRVRKVGGLSIGGGAGTTAAVAGLALSVAVLAYAVRVSAGAGGRPAGAEARRIERSVTIATVIELVASCAFPLIVVAAGHSDWVLPSIAITIGPLLLWLDHVVHIPRLRPVGWALTIGPFLLVAVLSGSALAATTGITAGLLLLGTAAAGFHDLAELVRRPPTTTIRTSPSPTGA